LVTAVTNRGGGRARKKGEKGFRWGGGLSSRVPQGDKLKVFTGGRSVK